MEKVFQSYFGSKQGAGTYHQIINLIRPHQRYIEPYLGSGAVMLRKKKAQLNIGNDVDTKVYQKWATKRFDWLDLHCKDAVVLLEQLPYSSSIPTVVYLDPPYLKSSRRNSRNAYRHEMTDAQHIKMLELAIKLPCDVLISSYENELYKRMLAGWNVHKFNSITRAGVATEYVFYNYTNASSVLHEYSYLGTSFTERQRIKRKITREINRLANMNPFERNAIIEAVLQQHNKP